MDELVTDWQVVAGRIWGILIRRLAPQQVAALRRIAHTHPTTRELARYLEVSETQAGNITRQLYNEGFLTRAKSGRSYRWSPAFPHPISLHYFGPRAHHDHRSRGRRSGRENPQKEGQARCLSRLSTGRRRP